MQTARSLVRISFVSRREEPAEWNLPEAKSGKTGQISLSRCSKSWFVIASFPQSCFAAIPNLSALEKEQAIIDVPIGEYVHIS